MNNKADVPNPNNPESRVGEFDKVDANEPPKKEPNNKESGPIAAEGSEVDLRRPYKAVARVKPKNAISTDNDAESIVLAEGPAAMAIPIKRPSKAASIDSAVINVVGKALFSFL
mmetsp:Transcript_12615/g.18546  ORF Transcript_12615/g.18546 Transcript_12615/m.18546 type:complete len:114 (-) Transcript_12615:503-844(-)